MSHISCINTQWIFSFITLFSYFFTYKQKWIVSLSNLSVIIVFVSTWHTLIFNRNNLFNFGTVSWSRYVYIQWLFCQNIVSEIKTLYQITLVVYDWELLSKWTKLFIDQKKKKISKHYYLEFRRLQSKTEIGMIFGWNLHGSHDPAGSIVPVTSSIHSYIYTIPESIWENRQWWHQSALIWLNNKLLKLYTLKKKCGGSWNISRQQKGLNPPLSKFQLCWL